MKTLHGIGASAGIGIGKAVCMRGQNLDYSAVQYGGAGAEKARLRKAVQQFSEDTQAMADEIRARVGQKEAEILEGQVTMLGDPFMLSQMEEGMDAGQTAEAALDAVCTAYADMFAAMEDDLMRQRAADVRDIRARMLGLLLGVRAVDLAALPVGTVLVAHDLTPSMTVGLQKEHVAAILTEVGGRTSHSAILARALELPAVLSAEGVLEQVRDGETVIVDGTAGDVLLAPDGAQLAAYGEKQAEELRRRQLLAVYRDKPTLDADGNGFALYANIGRAKEAAAALEAGAEGIGLFRTEFLFMDRAALPTEEEQYQAYRAVSEAMAGREVIIRTLDVGGDKAIGYLGLEKEENPFLGYRAIRYCLDRPDVFKVQLRALLRAGARQRNIKLMLPLVTGLSEVRAAKELLETCKAELAAEGLPFDAEMPLGVMIETPAAALTADLLAAETDFFSIGTNDLAQYILAVDRGNAKVEKLYTALHPAVLRAVRGVIQAAKNAGIPVGMCGEAAADPRMIPLLLGLGLDEFSVGAASILPTRAAIAGWGGEAAAQLAEAALACSTDGELAALLETACGD